jgi:hypothetical protein
MEKGREKGRESWKGERGKRGEGKEGRGREEKELKERRGRRRWRKWMGMSAECRCRTRGGLHSGGMSHASAAKPLALITPAASAHHHRISAGTGEQRATKGRR